MSNVQVTPGSGATIAAEDDGTGILTQAVKMKYGADGVMTQITKNTPLPTLDPLAATSTSQPVGALTSATQILAANTARRFYSVWNDSTSTMFVLQGGTGPVSNSNYSFQVPAGGFFETDRWAGVVSAIWTTANGAARVTEYTA